MMMTMMIILFLLSPLEKDGCEFMTMTNTTIGSGGKASFCCDLIFPKVRLFSVIYYY